jgi:hypothetical protein
MLKTLAVVRTLFLVFIVGFTARAMPAFINLPKTFDESYARCTESQGLLLRAAWLAIGWIALETIVGWIMARRRPAAPAVPPASVSGR